jgi:fumarylacetoacetase
MSAAPGPDATHDPALESWVESANDPLTDFPIQNLPLGRIRQDTSAPWRPAMAIGDQVLDLARAGFLSSEDSAALLALPASARRELRARVSRSLRRGAAPPPCVRESLYPAGAVQVGLPCEIPDFTDFYIGIHHATAVGKLLRPDSPLLPNYRWIPIGYHGRASTVVASGSDVRRPRGQVKDADDAPPVLLPTRRLDFELELGIVIGRPNARGEPIPIESAEEHVAGLVLLNDWSARDIQAWETMPLGPFLSKSFATTISPWIVTLEALAPFRRPFARPAGQPGPLPYLQCEANERAGAIGIELEARLQTRSMRERSAPAQPIAASDFAEAAYWTMAQLVAHHSVNGCALRTGDLLGSGTLSGPAPEQAGSLLELTAGGRRAIRLASGEERRFLEDGDRVELRGRCARAGWRPIGFGECSGTIVP